MTNALLTEEHEKKSYEILESKLNLLSLKLTILFKKTKKKNTSMIFKMNTTE